MERDPSRRSEYANVTFNPSSSHTYTRATFTSAWNMNIATLTDSYDLDEHELFFLHFILCVCV